MDTTDRRMLNIDVGITSADSDIDLLAVNKTKPLEAGIRIKHSFNDQYTIATIGACCRFRNFEVENRCRAGFGEAVISIGFQWRSNRFVRSWLNMTFRSRDGCVSGVALT